MSTVWMLHTPTGQEYAVTRLLRIGREPECEILLKDDLVSRLHASLWLEKGQLLLRDERSSNGTFVNGTALTPAKPQVLQAGDEVRVGDTLFTIQTAPAEVMQTRQRPVPAAAAPGPLPAAERAPIAEAAPGRAAPPAAAKPVPPESPRRRSWLVGGCALLVLLAVCGGLGLFGATAGRPAIATALAQQGGPGIPTPPTRGPSIGATASPGPGTAVPATPAVNGSTYPVQIVSTSRPATPLAVADYAATNQDLTSALAALNQAQLRFIADAQSKSNALDEDLRTMAAQAFKVGLDGETLARATAAQDGASKAAGQMAGLYAGLAGYGFAQAIDAQNLRTALAAGTLDAATAAAQVADYGARAWNPSVTDPAAPGNPFLAHLSPDDQVPAPAPVPPTGQAAITGALGAGAGAFTWLAAPDGAVMRTVQLPFAPPLANPQDPALVASLITPAGQADATTAQQAAAAGLLRLGATRQQPTGQHPSGLLAVLWSPPEQAAKDSLSFSAPRSTLLSNSPKRENLQAFSNGHAVASKANPPTSGSSDPNIMDTLFGTDANNQPTQQGTVPVQAKAPVVSLAISNVTIKSINKRDKSANSTFEADVQYEFDVQWTSSLVSPQFTLDCVSGNHFEITTASGTQHISAKGLLILYPGTENAYCYASRYGNSLGSASMSFLVGDADAATQRAIQVETDSAALDLTLTADANGTATAQAQAATQTAAVLGTQNALETEQAVNQTAEFRATITEIAHQTEAAAAAVPSATATFAPVLVETLEHPGNVFAVSTKTVLQPKHVYEFCFSGTVNLINPTKAAKASDIDHVNGVAVPLGGCLEVAGTGKVAVISCGSGEVDTNDPGGFTIRVTDLGPA